MREKHANLSDEELVSLAQRGDVSAFEEIYDRHASAVAKVVESFAGSDRDVVDDLTQDVFFRVVKGISSYHPSHPFKHWLYTIALNVGRNHVRKEAKVVFLDDKELGELPAQKVAKKDWPEELLACALMRAVSHLPSRMIEVVSLRIGAGMSFGEIGEMVGIPEGTARSRMHNALKILRSRVGIERPPERAKKEKNERGT